jgi:hypothetical protein
MDFLPSDAVVVATVAVPAAADSAVAVAVEPGDDSATVPAPDDAKDPRRTAAMTDRPGIIPPVLIQGSLHRESSRRLHDAVADRRLEVTEKAKAPATTSQSTANAASTRTIGRSNRAAGSRRPEPSSAALVSRDNLMGRKLRDLAHSLEKAVCASLPKGDDRFHFNLAVGRPSFVREKASTCVEKPRQEKW